MHETADVFGVRSKLIGSYIERELVDEKFKKAIRDGNEVIVYGSSKQGKTSLILKHLSPSEYVKVECSPKTQPVDIYKSILRQIDVSFVEKDSEEKENAAGTKVSGGLKVKVPFLGEANLGAETNNTKKTKTTSTVTYIEYNLSLAQDVLELLKKVQFNRYVILENFHYLELPVQETLAFDLRVFQDQHLIFIILGIWREANRLVQFNGDLLDRVTEVPVEPWSDDDFSKVISKGEELLNVDFSDIKQKLIKDSFD